MTIKNSTLPVTPDDYDEEPSPDVVIVSWADWLCRAIAAAQIKCQTEHYNAVEISCALYFGVEDQETGEVDCDDFDHIENLHARVTPHGLSFHGNSKWSDGEFFTTDEDNPVEITLDLSEMRRSIEEEVTVEVIF